MKSVISIAFQDLLKNSYRASAMLKDFAGGQNSHNRGQARLICFVPIASAEVKFILYSKKPERKTGMWRETAKPLLSVGGKRTMSSRAAWPSPCRFNIPSFALSVHARTENPDSQRNLRRHPHPGSTSNVTFSPRGVLNRPNDSRNVHLAY